MCLCITDLLCCSTGTKHCKSTILPIKNKKYFQYKWDGVRKEQLCNKYQFLSSVTGGKTSFFFTNITLLQLLEDNGTPLQYSCLENPMDGGAWQAAVHGVAKSQTRLSDFTLTFHFHALEKEVAIHSSILAWRIPGTGEPGGLPSMGSHRVRYH